MFIRKFLEPNKVDDVNTAGQFIKVMNCEGVVRMRVTFQGEIVLESDAKAGFDVRTSTPFDLIQITSETEQKLELWVSKHQLSYDALSTKPNRSQSFIVDHFGQSQMVLPYDPAQARAKIASEGAAFWVGGEGVSRESGIYISQGSFYNHDSAAPLHVFVDALPDRYFNPEKIVKVDAPEKTWSGSHAISGNYSLVKDGNDILRTLVTNLDTGVVVDAGYTSRNVFTAIDGGFAGGTASGNVTIFDYAGNAEGYENPIDGGNFRCRTICALDGVVYQMGSNSDDEDRKIIVFNNGVFSELNVPELIKRVSVYRSFVDAVDGVIWFIDTDYNLYFTKDKFLTVTKIEGITADYDRKNLKMSFNQKHSMIVGSGFCVVIDKETLEYKSLEGKVPSPKGGLLLDSEWLIVSGRKIYSSTDEFETYNEAYVNEYDFIIGAAAIHEHNGALYLEQRDDEKNTSILKSALDIDLTKPKAQIKVFKESF